MEYPAEQAEQLNTSIFAPYLDGLRAAGWRGESKVVACGYAIAATLYSLELLARDLRGIHGGVPDAVVEQVFRHSVEEVLDQHRQILGLTLTLADEARLLIEELKL